MIRLLAVPVASMAVVMFVVSVPVRSAERKVQIEDFGTTKDGTAIHRYILRNEKGVEAAVIS
jgi:hypothetical protein